MHQTTIPSGLLSCFLLIPLRGQGACQKQVVAGDRGCSAKNIMLSRFTKKLNEHIGFIQRSCVEFDSGIEEEAIRIAASLRVLFHDTRSSTSLLSHLKLTGSKVLSSSGAHGNFKDFLGQRIDVSSATPVIMIPVLGDKFKEVSVKSWWDEEPVFNHAGKSFSRKMIILSIANKDGGSHVDKDLQPYYEILCAGEYALGITGSLEYAGEPPFEQGVTKYPPNAHLALMRQFAHEVLLTSKHYKWS